MKKQAQQGKHKVIKAVIVLLLAVLVYLMVTMASIVAFSEKDETRAADAAVVLGASVYDNSPSAVFCERINHAVDLYNDGYVDVIIVIVILLEIIGLYKSISDRKWTIFAYYTQISNIITLISSIVLITSGTNTISVTLRYVSSCMLTMTFLITLFVLVPMGGGFKRLMLSGNGLYHHTLCPILSVWSYITTKMHTSIRRISLMMDSATPTNTLL